MDLIKSVQNKIVKQVYSLKDKKYRQKLGLFIIEGERFVSEIPNDWEVLYYILSEDFKNSFFYSKNKFIVTKQIFKKISETSNPQGIMAICKIKNFHLEEILKIKNPYFVMLDRITNPGNLGTIIRTADALGFNGVFLSEGCADLYNSKVLRSTMGSIFNIPIVQNCDLDLLINRLKTNKINIITTSLNADKYIYDIDLKNPFSLIIGNEANGVLEELNLKADFKVKIPMLGKAESLNAAIASAIFFYEFTRQNLKI